MKKAGRILLLAIAVVICVPVVMLLIGSIASPQELNASLAPLWSDTKGLVSFPVFPKYPTLENLLEVLFKQPGYFTVFWNSMKMTAWILLGQLLAAVPAAWAFARFRFRGRHLLFTLYVILMLMPFQVTMLSSYLVLHSMKLLDTQWAVILPAVFSTFPVFLIYRGFTAIPREILEAASVDGAGEWHIFLFVGLPLGSGGILSAFVLGFLESFALMEQPMAFLKDQSLWPLSLYLPEIGPDQAGWAFAASVIALVPPALVFIIGQEYLERGILSSGMR